MSKYEYKTINGRKERLHRLIMEEHLGRLLEKNEHVYHIDGDHRNNDIENLVLIKKQVCPCEPLG